MTETPKKKPVKRTTKRVVAKTTRKKKVVVPRAKRPKKLRLTPQERRFLEYPPTAGTWRCPCGIVNGRTAEYCLSCMEPVGDTPKLVYDIYAKACVKVGIEEGGMWKYSDKLRSPIVRYSGSWKIAELPEGLTI